MGQSRGGEKNGTSWAVCVCVTERETETEKDREKETGRETKKAGWGEVRQVR